MSRVFSHSLFARLTLTLLGLYLLTGAAYLALVLWSSGRYYEEITQRLNQSLAMYIAQREPLLQNGIINHASMHELSTLVMIVNPIVEVYLLDAAGKILAHSLPQETLLRRQVDVSSIQTLLTGHSSLPLRGDDPRQAEGRKVFSAFPLTENGQTTGYLYVVLGGQDYQTLAESLRGSYILRTSLIGIGLIIVFGFAVVALIFAVLTRPLRRLSQDITRFERDELRRSSAEPQIQGNELSQLGHAFSEMKQRIRDQFERLQETDRVRRELISNVSHDLRTPLSSMQGYLETLMLKEAELNSTDRRKYLNTAYRHCRRLTQLVTELFELSKLDAGRTQPNWETFSLAELLHDVAQKFELTAQQKHIRLLVNGPEGLYPVCADIALIERVLENLIDNALRYTPNGGRVELRLKQCNSHVEVKIADTGIGVPPADLPHIFERYYKVSSASADITQDDRASTGLGLAIVKRILELHGSWIEVSSQPKQGTCFKFLLPTQVALAGVH